MYQCTGLCVLLAGHGRPRPIKRFYSAEGLPRAIKSFDRSRAVNSANRTQTRHWYIRWFMFRDLITTDVMTTLLAERSFSNCVCLAYYESQEKAVYSESRFALQAWLTWTTTRHKILNSKTSGFLGKLKYCDPESTCLTLLTWGMITSSSTKEV